MTEVQGAGQAVSPGSGKTLGVKLSDETHAQLVLIAGLEQVSLADLIRQAIEVYLAQKRGDGALAARAAEAAQEIEREATLRREALNSLFGSQAQAGDPARRRGKEAAP
jgi:hypothetical protein